MNPLEVVAMLGTLAEPVAQMLEMAMAKAHSEDDEAKLMFKIQRAITNARAQRKFGSGTPTPTTNPSATPVPET